MSGVGLRRGLSPRRSIRVGTHRYVDAGRLTLSRTDSPRTEKRWGQIPARGWFLAIVPEGPRLNCPSVGDSVAIRVERLIACRAGANSQQYEGLLGGFELRCAKEGLCMTVDAHSAAGFGGQQGNVVCLRKIMVASETQEFE